MATIPQLISIVTGGFLGVKPVTQSSGSSSAGSLVALNSSGLVDSTMLPPTNQVLGGGAAVLSASQTVLMVCLPYSGTLPANFTGSTASCQTTATDSATFTVYHIPSGTNTQNNIGTITFAPSAYTATFSSSTAATIGVGDTIQIIAPSTVDATLATVAISLFFQPTTNVMSISGGAGTLTASSILLAYCSTVAGSISTNFGGSVASCLSPATDSTTFTIYHIPSGTNTQTEIGTMIFAPNEYTATFESSSGADLAFAIGDTLMILCPSTADATLANITCSIVGVN